MSNPARTRLFVLQVIVLSVLATLLGRLCFLQVAEGAAYSKAAEDNRIRTIVEPATRGMVYDSSGRVLVENRTALVVSVNRTTLRRQTDRGAAVLARLSGVIGIPAVDIARQITPCGEKYADGTPAKAPDCWNGSPYQPIPVRSYDLDDPAQTPPVLAIEEHREDFPGVTAELEPVRYYPNGQLAAHLLGYIGPIRDDERKDPRYGGLTTAKVGRGGVEEVYDDELRGVDGREQLLVDRRGNVTGTHATTDPAAGDALVLSLDRDLQQVAEKALRDGIARARQTTDPRRGTKYKAPTGAVVVLEANTGRVAAMASYPSYDPTLFTKPLLPPTYQALTDQAKGAPLYSNATQGTFAPGSTFKIVSTAAAVAAGNPLLRQLRLPVVVPGRQPFLPQLRGRDARDDRPAHHADQVLRHRLLRPGLPRVAARRRAAAQGHAARVLRHHGQVLRLRPPDAASTCRATRPARSCRGRAAWPTTPRTRTTTAPEPRTPSCPTTAARSTPRTASTARPTRRGRRRCSPSARAT